ncbi:PD-(D/E)XK nuclease-like domain-containing protein [Streptacidiphilus sp. EB129]|uniref:PD-(D/E)XK nuclease-like domain-containing protein n=1 Tax=Streptacidiphilus sp. EB129 TaxID=3156262 RepID=UPI003516CBFA
MTAPTLSLADIPLPLAASREPGVYDGIPIDEYHADTTSLSVSGAKELLASCPAKFRYQQDHPQPPTPAMEFGTAAHAVILGVGPEVVVCDFASWKSVAAQDKKSEALAAGEIPVLAKDMTRLEGMAAAIRNHETAGPLFAPGSGKAEQSLYLPHGLTGVMRRARPDWLPHFTGERLRVPDLKTCASAHLDAIEKDVANYRYYQQAPWYLDVIKGLGLCGDEPPVFLFVFIEKDPPYLISVVELIAPYVKAGRDENNTALHLYADCLAKNDWPDYMRPYHPYLPEVAPPVWLERRFA